MKRVEKYNSQVFKSHIMGEKVVFMCGAAGNKFLFSNENKTVTVWWPRLRQGAAGLGQCVSTTAGEEGCCLMRKQVCYFVSPDAFTKLYIKRINMVSQHHIKTHWQGKDEVRVFPTIKQYTFELACRLFMGLEDEIATRAIKEELLKIVRARRVSSEQKVDLLSHLLNTPDENDKYMSESVIVNNILMLLFAGHDTSSVAITLAMRWLADRPDIYDKVFTEHEDIGESVQWEDLQKMKYTWWSVVCEVMRLAPPVIGAFRETLTDISYGGYPIPKGSKLYWSANSTHMDPSYFTSNTKFDPSRFEEAPGLAPYTYVVFGWGQGCASGKSLLGSRYYCFA
ncbi:hypothetical protein SASPL_101031 [Salvia splendens]|uniref:Uncharacterized protein n=1 Tax=Salvia splendens TaxID=180675 RepID=A0A8X8YT86_SALSN|nr:hypothetical protein SASPL_101031 [Salvia splendens]